jgi:NAD(P) transhydrogenase
MRYDLLVIGNDPAGRWSAVSAAKLSKRVAIIESPRDRLSELEHAARSKLPEILTERLVADSSAREGIPSPRPCDFAASSLSALREQLHSAADLDHDVFADLFLRYDVDTFHGDARLIDEHSVLVDDELRSFWVEAHRIVIATGSRPRRPEQLPADDTSILDSRTVWDRSELPDGDAVVIGAGSTGASHAALLASLGVPVRLVDGRATALADCHQTIRELIEAYRLTGKVVLESGEEAIALEQLSDGMLRTVLTTGRRVTSQFALLALERLGVTEHLNLTAAGLNADENGRLWCDGYYRTWVSHIYGLGDVVGYPQSRMSAMDQGLRLVRHAFHTSRTRTAAMRQHLSDCRRTIATCRERAIA